MEPLISVIVPVYNVEKYIDRCLNSITNQSYRNLEIILIDDGAKDASGSLCDEWADRDSRVKVIHKVNAGLGMARNTGLENCTGDYVAFVDSDDFVELCMFEKMLIALNNSGANTCYCSHQTYANDKNEVLEQFPEAEGEYDGVNVLLDILGSEPSSSKDCMRQMSVWGALFSGDIIRKYMLRFKSEREYICEDLPFDVQYLSKVEKIVVIKECLYNYCVNTESLTHKYYNDRLMREKKLYMYICDSMDRILPGIEYKTRYNRLFLGRIRNCILQEVNDSNKTYSETIKGISMIASDPLVNAVVHDYPIWKTPCKQRIFNIALRLKMNRLMFLLAKVH